MSATITFPVPTTTTSRFVVAAESVPKELTSLVHARTTGAFQTHVRGRAGTPQLDVSREESAWLRWDPTSIRAVHPEHRRAETAFHHAREFAVITASGPVTDQPRGVQVARAAAYGVAEATGGVAADLVTGHIFHTAAANLTGRPAPPSERPRFVLADQWLGEALPPFRANGRCTAADPEQDPEGVNGCCCVRLMTRGLRRFGLPELQITDVACPHDVAALNVLRTTARRLLTDHWAWLATGPACRTRTIAAGTSLTTGDFDDFWGSSRRNGSPSAEPFRILLRPTTPRLITVGPPEDYRGTVNDWLWSGSLPGGMYDILSSPADEDALASPVQSPADP
ncbi:hypothetical protein [Spirillospora sp. NBC_01491]|uniref:hypothetical protein n=1 Tax=Spirillospora sp. NBC_01491 TaxID=2976007 RepID=UPI002E322C51|nr:hypothetical protein [Spirillospora sp. NBC_01491]